MWQVLLAAAVAGCSTFVANHFLHHLNHKEEELSSIEMDQPEAEERLEAKMVEDRGLQNSETGLDVQYEVFRDGVDELEGIITQQKENGSLPAEIYQEVCHSLIEQQGNKIQKLQSKLKEKEAQLQRLKDYIRRLNEEKNCGGFALKVDKISGGFALKKSKTVKTFGSPFSKGGSGLLLIPCASFALGGWFRGVFLFGCGIGVGIMYMTSAGKAEISKLSRAMDETSKVVQELKTELSTMILGAEQGEKRFAVPGIEEEICKSSESISTDKSTTSGIPEDDLFGDSIQKSSKEIQKAEKREEKLALTGGVEEDTGRSNGSVSTLTTANSTLGGPLEDDLSGASERVSSVSQNKRGSRTGELASSSRASSLSATPTKRASLSANCIKVEKDNGKTVNGISASSCGVPMPLPSVKSSSRAVKIQLSPSSSSIDSFRRSLSSNSSSKHSPEIEIEKRKKIDSKSTSSIVRRSTTRTAPTNRNQSMSSRISPRLKSLTKPSSSISPASFRCWKPF